MTGSENIAVLFQVGRAPPSTLYSHFISRRVIRVSERERKRPNTVCRREMGIYSVRKLEGKSNEAEREREKNVGFCVACCVVQGLSLSLLLFDENRNCVRDLFDNKNVLELKS